MARLDQLSYYPQLLARAAALHHEGFKRVAIADVLNAEGWRPAKRRATFTAEMVSSLLVRQGLVSAGTRSRSVVRQASEWTLPELARELDMPHPTLYRWLYKGDLKSRRDQGGVQWLVWADDQELQRLRELRQAPRTWKRPTPQVSAESSLTALRQGEAHRGDST